MAESSSIKPLRNESDYRSAMEAIWELMDAPPGSEAEDRLEVLSVLAADYEKSHYPISAPNPVAVLEQVMEAKALSRGDMAQYLGSKSRVAEVFGRKRRLSLEMIRKLHAHLGIPTDLLVTPYELRPASNRPRRRTSPPLKA